MGRKQNGVGKEWGDGAERDMEEVVLEAAALTTSYPLLPEKNLPSQVHLDFCGEIHSATGGLSPGKATNVPLEEEASRTAPSLQDAAYAPTRNYIGRGRLGSIPLKETGINKYYPHVAVGEADSAILHRHKPHFSQ